MLTGGFSFKTRSGTLHDKAALALGISWEVTISLTTQRALGHLDRAGSFIRSSGFAGTQALLARCEVYRTGEPSVQVEW